MVTLTLGGKKFVNADCIVEIFIITFFFFSFRMSLVKLAAVAYFA